MYIEIDLNAYNTFLTTIRDLECIASFPQNDKYIRINVLYTCGNFVDNDSYILIASAVQDLRANGYSVTVQFNTHQNCPTVDYASRINFFSNVGIDYKEGFQRRPTRGRFFEMTRIPSGGYGILSEEQTRVFERSFNLGAIEFESLVHCVNELICNMTMHSESKSGGLVFSQNYPQRNILDFVVCDRGVGVPTTLRRNYANLSNKEALKKCIDFEVTCGNGRGHGLYHVAELVKRNGGTMHLASLDHVLVVRPDKTEVFLNNYWPGTFLKFALDTRNPLPLTEVLEDCNYIM